MRAPFQVLAIPYKKRQEYQFCVFKRANTYVIPEYGFGFKCDTDICLSDEHIGFEWLNYEEAMSKLTWDSNKTALYELKGRLLAEK